MNEYKNELAESSDKKTKELLKEMPDFATNFFTRLSQKGASPLTIQQYAYDMKKFFKWVEESAGFKDINIHSLPAREILDKLTIKDLSEYIETLKTYVDENGKVKLTSPPAKARKISCLRSFYKYFFTIGDISNATYELIEVPPIPAKEIAVLDKSHVKRILDAICDTSNMDANELAKHQKVEKRDYAIVMLLFGTGIRVSELVGADITDVDFFEYIQDGDESRGMLLVTRKGGNEDEVYFAQEVKDALIDYKNNCRDALLAGKKNDALFISMQHKRMTVRTVQKMIESYADKAGINVKCSPHKLRKTYGTNLYNVTGDIYLVADSLGHSSVETTRKHYAKVSTEHKKLAAKYSSDLFKED